MTDPLPQTTINQQRWPFVAPTMTDVLNQLKRDIFADLRVCVPAQIVSYDGAKHTASLQILLTRTLADGRTVADYPQLDSVPVWTPQGGGAYLQFPIAAGDQGILLFADRNIRSWLQNGAPAPLPTPRMHSLSDGLFIPGLNALNDAKIPASPTNKVVLSYQGTSLELDGSGWKIIGDGSAEIDVQGDLVTIKNATTTLNTIITLFLTMLEALTIQDPISGPIPLTAASIAAIEAFKAQFAELLG